MQFDREYIEKKNLKIDRQILKDGRELHFGNITLKIKVLSSSPP